MPFLILHTLFPNKDFFSGCRGEMFAACWCSSCMFSNAPSCLCTAWRRAESRWVWRCESKFCWSVSEQDTSSRESLHVHWHRNHWCCPSQSCMACAFSCTKEGFVVHLTCMVGDQRFAEPVNRHWTRNTMLCVSCCITDSISLWRP